MGKIHNLAGYFSLAIIYFKPILYLKSGKNVGAKHWRLYLQEKTTISIRQCFALTPPMND